MVKKKFPLEECLLCGVVHDGACPPPPEPEYTSAERYAGEPLPDEDES